MKVCSKGHEAICHEGDFCPLCKKLKVPAFDLNWREELLLLRECVESHGCLGKRCVCGVWKVQPQFMQAGGA